MKATTLLAEADGYACLEMWQEAATGYQAAAKADGKISTIAWNGFLRAETAQGKYLSAVEAGVDLLERGEGNATTVVLTALCLSFLKRPLEGRDLLAQLDKFGRPVSRHAYQMACFEARLGNCAEALRWLEIELEKPRHFTSRSIADSDLRPLWDWLATGPLTLEDAHRFLKVHCSPEYGAALQSDGFDSVDANDFDEFPARFRSLFRYSAHSGLWEIDYGRITSKRLADYCRYRTREHARLVATVQQGHEQAFRLVLAAQPSYASRQALQRNHMAARLHITWALYHDPTLIDDFRAEKEMENMSPFLDSLSSVLAVDGDFCRRMVQVADLSARDVDDAWRVLEQTPAAARHHPLFLLREALLHRCENDDRRCLASYLRVCDLWPDDVCAFGNICNLLCKRGRWEAAQQIFDRAPVSYTAFWLRDTQEIDLAAREMIWETPATRPFRGEPDLGGFLKSSALPRQETSDATR